MSVFRIDYLFFFLEKNFCLQGSARSAGPSEVEAQLSLGCGAVSATEREALVDVC